MTQPRPQRILVVRNDKLGDFMLAWPALACLKSAHPDNHVAVLVPTYTAPLAHACPWVDEVILDPGDGAPRAQRKALRAALRAGGLRRAVDAVLHAAHRLAGVARRHFPAHGARHQVGTGILQLPH